MPRDFHSEPKGIQPDTLLPTPEEPSGERRHGSAGEFRRSDLTEALLRSAGFGRTKLFEEHNAIPLLIEFNFIHEGLNQKQASATDALKIRRIRGIGQ